MSKPESKEEPPAPSCSCLNCGATVDGSYCASCGQRGDVGPLKLRTIAAEIISSILEFELPIVRTTFALLRSPGTVAAAWVGGQRRRYTNPMKFCIISGLVMMFAIAFIPQLTNAAQPAAANGAAEVVMKIVTEYMSLLMILLAVPLGWINGLIGRAFRIQRSGMDWYVLALYCIGISVPAQLILGMLGTVGMMLSGPLPVLAYFWGAWAFNGSAQRWRSMASGFLSVILWIVVISIVSQGLLVLLAV